MNASKLSAQRQSAPTGAQEPEFKQGADRPLGDASCCALFSGHCYYPEGGAEDFRAWGSIEELKELYAANADKWSKDAAGTYADPWGQIVDMETMTIMLTIRGHGDWTQCHRAPKDETSRCADQSEIPEDQVLGEFNWGGGKIVEYMIPNLTEEEKTEARKSWAEDVERMGGVENYLRNTALYDLGVLLGGSPLTLKNTLNQP